LQVYKVYKELLDLVEGHQDHKGRLAHKVLVLQDRKVLGVQQVFRALPEDLLD
jgi:hypothetical protein